MEFLHTNKRPSYLKVDVSLQDASNGKSDNIQSYHAAAMLCDGYIINHLPYKYHELHSSYF